MALYKVWNPHWSNEADAKTFEAEDPENAAEEYIRSRAQDHFEWPEEFRVCVLNEEDGFFCMADVSTVRRYDARVKVTGLVQFTCRIEDGGHSPTRSFLARDAAHAAILYAAYIFHGADEPRPTNEDYVVLVMSDKPSIRPSVFSKFLVIREGTRFSATRTIET